MSLLNDALRKRAREMRPPLALPTGGSPPPTRRTAQRRIGWIAGIGVTVLLIAGLGVGLVVHSIEAPSASLVEAASITAAPVDPPKAGTVAPAGAPVGPASSRAMPEGGGPVGKPTGETSSRHDAPAVHAAKDPGGNPALPSAAAIPRPTAADKAFEAPRTKNPSASGPAAPAAHPSRAVRQEDRGLQGETESALVERYYRKALSYHRQGRTERAIALYRDALQLQPQHFDARFNLVSVYIERGEYDHAHRMAQALHRENGTNPQVLTNLAIAKIGLGQFREALELLDQVADTPQGETFTVLLHKGIANRGLDQLDAAVAWYQKAYDLNPDHPRLLFNLALAHDRRQDYAAALRYYQAYRERAAGTDSREQKDIRERMRLLRTYLAAEDAQKAGEP